MQPRPPDGSKCSIKPTSSKLASGGHSETDKIDFMEKQKGDKLECIKTLIFQGKTNIAIENITFITLFFKLYLYRNVLQIFYIT